MSDEIERRINQIDQFVASMGVRLTVIESIINEESSREMRETSDSLKILMLGDDSLSIPPISEQIRDILQFHETIKETILGLRATVIGLIIFDAIIAMAQLVTFLVLISQ